MKRIEDFRTGELRIPADRFPLPARVEELLRVYSGFGQWEGAPYGPQSVAVFELPLSRLEEIERAFEDAAGELIVANIPEWVNRSPESPENGPQAPGRAWARVRPQAPARGNLGAGAGLVVIGACLGLVCVMLALVYFVGS